MGSPLSPVLANLCMEFFEKLFVNNIPAHIKHELWVRYVDDIFIIYKHNQVAFDAFVNTLNSKIPSINFTVEKEVNHKLPFLDTTVHRGANGFRFSIYRKKTHTNSYIHFFSCHERKVKVNVLTNLFFRAYRICDPSYIDEEIKFLFESFTKLSYPKQFMQHCLSKARKMYYNPTERDPLDFGKTVCMPYHPELQPLANNLNRDTEWLTTQHHAKHQNNHWVKLMERNL